MFLYMIAAGLGLSALFIAVPVAYDTVRIAGAAYVLWLAYKVATHRTSPQEKSNLSRESTSLLYRRGFLTCLLNPKVAVTY